MKTLFIEARRKNPCISGKEAEKISKLGDIHILYSIQYKKLACKIKERLGKKAVKIEQVLGCSKIKPKATLLLVGSGRFHALNLAYSANHPIYIYNSGSIEKIGEEEIEKYKKKEKGKISRFLASNNIGVIFSQKSGQYKNPESITRRLKSKYKGKNFYFFLADNIIINELENFNADFWINTACPGLELDSSKIINYDKVI